MRFEARRHRQPWSFFAKAGVGVVIPLHGRALTIAALLLRPAQLPDGVFHLVTAFRIIVLHADLFTVVHDGRAAQRQEHGGHQFCDGIIMLAVTVAIVVPHLVVIAEHPHRPAVLGILIPLGDLLAEFRRRQLVHFGEEKVHGKLQLVEIRPVEFRQFGHIVRPGFADQHAIARFIRNFPQTAQLIVHLRQAIVVLVFHVGIAELVQPWRDGIIGKLGIFEQSGHRIQPEARYAALEPVARHVHHGFFHFRISPVEVRLLAIEKMVVILICGGIELPSRAAES